MNRFHSPRVAVSVLLCAAAIMFVPVSAQSDATTPIGALWEVTSQMSMEGMDMKMPARKMKVCTPVNWTAPPGSNNEEQGCVNSDYLRVEDTVTWTSTCTGAQAMSGQGEIKFTGDDAYTGAINYASDEGAIVIKLDGHRIGDCDKPR